MARIKLAAIVMVVVSLLLPGALGAAEALAAGPTITVEGPTDSATLKNATDVLGWAVDRAAAKGTGIDAVHIYLDGVAGKGKFLGAADYGLVRQDVAQALGSPRFAPSGFKYPFDVRDYVGERYLYVYARSVKTGWTHVKVKIIVEVETTNAPPAPPAPLRGPGPQFLAPPPGLPVAGQNYSYSYSASVQTQISGPAPTYGSPPTPPSAYGYNAPPAPPSGYGYSAPPAPPPAQPPLSPAWAVAQQAGQIGDYTLPYMDALYLGVGESSGAQLYALLIDPGGVPGWLGQSWEARYDWTLQTARAFASYHPGQPTAFMLMYYSIEPVPPPPDSKWAVNVGAGPQPGTFQVANVLAFGMHRPGQGYQIDIRSY